MPSLDGEEYLPEEVEAERFQKGIMESWGIEERTDGGTGSKSSNSRATVLVGVGEEEELGIGDWGLRRGGDDLGTCGS